MAVYMKELNKPIELFHDLLWASPGERPRRPMAVMQKFIYVLTDGAGITKSKHVTPPAILI